MDKYYLCNALSRFKTFTLVGLYRFIKLRILGKEVRIEGECLMCGQCCQEISLEVNGLWIRNRKQFERAVRRNQEYDRFVIVGRDPQGFLLFTCDWYLPESRLCGDYEHRPSICREFPQPSLYFSGGDVPRGCGYRFAIGAPFASILEEEMKKHHDTPPDSRR